MKRELFTAEELAELAAFDAMIDDEPEYDPEEVRAAAERDWAARQQARDTKAAAKAEYQRAYYAANREAVAEYKRAYYAANREALAEKHRAYRAANREAVAEYHRAYYAANREAVAEKHRAYRAAGSDGKAAASPLREWRKQRGLNQREAALLFGVNQASISNMERGITPLRADIRAAIGGNVTEERRDGADERKSDGAGGKNRRHARGPAGQVPAAGPRGCGGP